MVKPSHPRAGKSTAPPPSSSKSTASSAGASKHKDPTPAAQPDQDEEMPAPRTSAPTNARRTTRFSSRLPTPSCLPCHARRPQEPPGLRSLLRTLLRTHLTKRTTTLYSPTEQPASEHGELLLPRRSPPRITTRRSPARTRHRAMTAQHKRKILHKRVHLTPTQTQLHARNPESPALSPHPSCLKSHARRKGKCTNRSITFKTTDTHRIPTKLHTLTPPSPTSPSQTASESHLHMWGLGPQPQRTPTDNNSTQASINPINPTPAPAPATLYTASSQTLEAPTRAIAPPTPPPPPPPSPPLHPPHPHHHHHTLSHTS